MRFKSSIDLIIAAVCCLSTLGFASEPCGHQAQVESPGLPGGRQSITYCKSEGRDILQGDIILPPAPENREGAVEYAGFVNRKSGLWRDGRVPYQIHPSLGQTRRVTDAISHWQSQTGIQFIPRTDETDYLVFSPGKGCSSSIGRVGGRQLLVLAAGCDKGAVIHEIGHAVGLWHEQSRNDRDEFVQILWQNIGTDHRFNFSKFESGGANYGRYDFNSIMHYEAYAFSKNGSPTIVSRGSTQVPVASRNRLSDGDIAAVEYLYR